jgi:DNA-binding response OmpR family regulator
MSEGLVLVVDDEAPIRELCRVNLELAGFEVDEAGDGIQALDAVRRRRPDVVLLDVMMPNMDGWETLQRLKEDDETADIAVILLTARTSEDDQMRGWTGGILEFVPKPFNPQALTAAVRDALVPRDPATEADRRARILERLKFVRDLREGRSAR